MADAGPVSAALAADLREEARKHGVLVWLDKDGTYSPFVDRIRGDRDTFPYPVLAYRGSFLELMFELDGVADGVTMQPLLVHMPGFTEEDIAATPVYEIYRAGRRHRLALPTLVKNVAAGRVSPAETEAALASRIQSLEDADRWLAEAIAGAEAGGGPALALHSPRQLFDAVVRGEPPADQLDDPRALASIHRFLERTLGLDAAWRERFEPIADRTSDRLELLLSSWALCVEFVDDLDRPPQDDFLVPLKSLPKPLTAASRELAEHIRGTRKATYARDADEIEAFLVCETAAPDASVLGRIDTFRFEDRAVFRAAVTALRSERWDEAAGYAASRVPERSFWVAQSDARREAWTLVRTMSELGRACERHADLLDGVRRVEDAAGRYAAAGYEVDLLHRRLEQQRELLTTMPVDELPELLACLEQVRAAHRRWADAQAVAFNDLCRRQGFLPGASAQQRTLFDEVVRPRLAPGEPVAYFVVDALRFEMARQLADAIEPERGVKLELGWRLAELPTKTAVGMNVLAPVVRNGRVELDLAGDEIRGLRAGESRVSRPKDRQKAMHERAGGETCPWLTLEELLERDAQSLRKAIARAQLVVVHSEGIDRAGEHGLGLRQLDDELRRLRAAWARLRDAGIRRFVVTADHGFLLCPASTRQPVPHGRKTDPKGRFVVSRVGADHEGEIRASSRELLYDGEEVHFMFPATTMPFDTGERAKEFVHGGNSLQERVIPVLTASYRHAKGASAARYRVEARALGGEADLHRIQARLVHADESQRELGFGAAGRVQLALRAPEDPDVAVDLVNASGAELDAGIIAAPVERPFEIAFRLRGPRALRARVVLAGALAGDEIVEGTLERRFTVLTTATTSVSDEPEDARDEAAPSEAWLEELPKDARRVFAHLAKHDSINEREATELLGSARSFRRFSLKFEGYAERAPFEVQIDSSSGQKLYRKVRG